FAENSSKISEMTAGTPTVTASLVRGSLKSSEIHIMPKKLALTYIPASALAKRSYGSILDSGKRRLDFRYLYIIFAHLFDAEISGSQKGAEDFIACQLNAGR